jgi:hypothetical protein
MRRRPLIIAMALAAAAAGACTHDPIGPAGAFNRTKPALTEAATPPSDEATTQSTASDTTGGSQRGGSGGFGSGH